MKTLNSTTAESDVEAFAAAAFTGNIGIAEAERFIQAVFDKIDLSAVNQLQRIGGYDDSDALVFEYDIRVCNLVGIIDRIGIT